MATLNLTSIAADVKADRIETAVWKARKSLEYYAGNHLSDKERARLCEDIADYISDNEPQNAPVSAITSAMLFKGHQCSEYVVRKMVDAIIENGQPYIAAKKLEKPE
jgi:hypothetical protein